MTGWVCLQSDKKGQSWSGCRLVSSAQIKEGVDLGQEAHANPGVSETSRPQHRPASPEAHGCSPCSLCSL